MSSKHGLAGLTGALAVEWGSAGVRVVGVAPTLVETPGIDEIRRQVPPMAELIERTAASLPLGRICTADDVARIVLFAVSGLATVVTGSLILADAGAMQI